MGRTVPEPLLVTRTGTGGTGRPAQSEHCNGRIVPASEVRCAGVPIAAQRAGYALLQIATLLVGDSNAS